jgi:hypothetical protein
MERAGRKHKTPGLQVQCVIRKEWGIVAAGENGNLAS